MPVARPPNRANGKNGRTGDLVAKGWEADTYPERLSRCPCAPATASEHGAPRTRRAPNSDDLTAVYLIAYCEEVARRNLPARSLTARELRGHAGDVVGVLAIRAMSEVIVDAGNDPHGAIISARIVGCRQGTHVSRDHEKAQGRHGERSPSACTSPSPSDESQWHHGVKLSGQGGATEFRTCLAQTGLGDRAAPPDVFAWPSPEPPTLHHMQLNKSRRGGKLTDIPRASVEFWLHRLHPNTGFQEPFALSV